MSVEYRLVPPSPVIHPVAFEALLSELLVRFVHLPASALDAAIEETQRQVCAALELDRSVLWQMEPAETGRIVITHVWQPASALPVRRDADPKELTTSDWALEGEGIHAVPMGADGAAFFPSFLALARKREPIVIPRVEALPESVARERELILRFGARALVGVPLAVGDQFIGVLTFEMLTGRREWPAEMVQRMGLVAQVFAAALARQRGDEALRRTTARLELAAKAAGAGLWSMNIATGQWWATEKGRELFGFQANQKIDWEAIERVVHREDRARVREAWQEGLRHGGDVFVEYRVPGPGGSVKWYASRGKLHADSLGEKGEFLGCTTDVTQQKADEQSLKAALAEVQRLREELEQENSELRAQIHGRSRHEAIVGESPLILKVLAQAERVGLTDSSVLITGETGTGKELLAEAIQQQGARSRRPLVKVNCGALPASLIESELFGRERGAYTGAMTQSPGRFEAADGATLFLDEIAELPLELQPKLLRVLQEGQFERLGSSQTRKVDVRVIAATNRNLEQMVKEGRFRADLYYRLAVFPITLPPLRDRREDIPLLVWKFVKHFAGKMGKSIDSIPRNTMAALAAHAWPGNVRELRNLIERAVILTDSRVLHVELAPAIAETAPAATLEDVERQHIVSVLTQTNWRVSGPHGAAAVLGLVPTTLHSKMQKLKIPKPSEMRASPRTDVV